MRHRHHHRHDHDPDHSNLSEHELLLAILLVVEEIVELLAPPVHEPARATLAFEGGSSMSDITVPDTQDTLTATVAYADINGDPTSPVSVPVWSSSDESIATVDASADPSGLTATVTLLHAVGAATIDASETNTDGTVVTGSGTITVAAAEPATGDVTFA